MMLGKCVFGSAIAVSETMSRTMAAESKLSHAFNDGFENFFNNESLSDRILCICEVEEVQCYNLFESGRVKRKRSNDDTSLSFPLLKNIKQEEVEEYPDSATRNKSSCIRAGNKARKKESSCFHSVVKVEGVEDEANPVNSQEPHCSNQNSKDDDQLNNTFPAAIGVDTSCEEQMPIFPVPDNEMIDSENEISIVPSDENNPENGGETLQTNEDLPTDIEETTSTEVQAGGPVDISESLDLDMHHATEEGLMTDGDPDVDNEPLIFPRTEKKILSETRVFVHGVLLAAKSDFFKCLFSTSGMKETMEKEVKLEVRQGETETMMIMLRCFYNRDFINEHSLDDVIKVTSLAMQYCFDTLIDKCLDVFAMHAEAINSIEDFNRINIMVLKIQNDFNHHKEKCSLVLEKCRPFLVNNFFPLDENLEKVPCKFFMLRLEAMNLFLDPNVQESFKSPHGNVYIYAIQRWVRAHVVQLSDTNDYSKQYKLDIIAFVEKFLNTVNMLDVTSDFITNVMNYEISAFNVWTGYKEWYIKALQNFVYRVSTQRLQYHRPNPRLTRERQVHFARQEKNADIFSMLPVILNGFEIGIYLRVREDRKVHMLCKCKNFQSNKVGFDKAILTFSVKGVLKLNTVTSNLWKESFPRQLPQQAHFTPNDNFTFTYKQNTMCLQMYALCKLSPAVYNIAKKSGFFIEFEIQQLTT